MADITVSDLIGLAIQIENTCKTLYEGMEKKFVHTPEIATYWHHLANEEAGHARWLEDLRARSTANELQKKANAEVLQRAVLALKVSKFQSGKHIHNLEDAYQIANELENSETNAVFEFLITNYSGDHGTVHFLRNQLNAHMTDLQSKLPAMYQSKAARRAIKAS